MPQVRRQGAWLWLLVAAALLSQTALNLVRPVTTYKLLELEASAFTVGLVAAAYAVLPLVSAMWLGRLASRAGGLGRMVAMGAAVLGVGAAGLALAPNAALVGAASAVLGMGHLVFTIAGQSAVARYAPDDQLDKGFGWFTAAYSAGQMAGPLAGGLMLGAGSGGGSPEWSSSITMALWAGAAMSLAALPLMLLPSRLTAGAGPAEGPRNEAGGPEQAATLESTGESALAEPSAGRATLARILRVPGVGSHMAASLALLAMLDILIAFLPLVAEGAGVPPAVVGALLAVRGGASILSRAFLPWLSRRLGRRVLLLASLYGAAAALVAPPLTLGQPLLAGAFLFAGGLFLGLGQPITMTLVATAVPAPWRGPALAVRLMGNRAGQVAMPLAAGVAASGLGPAAAIWLCCGALALSGAEKAFRR